MITPYGGERELMDVGIPGGWGERDGVGPGVQAAADHIIAQQCGVGGFCWPHGTACCPTAPTNITGPIALGLLKAYDVTGDAAILTAATLAGDYDLAVQFPNTTPAFASFEPYFLHVLSDASYSNDPAYSNHAATGFFDALTAGTYGDSSVDGTYYPADTYDYIARHIAHRTGYAINLRPWDMQYMPWLAGQIGNADSTSPPDAVSQQATFLAHEMASINALDNTDPSSVYWDMIGLAGGVRSLALNGTTSFTALTAGNFDDIQGISTLCALANVLAGYQNADGSWYWSSNLSSPGEDDKDAQTTAYAILALLAAEAQGCGPYTSEIAAGRAWLDTLQDADGGFFSYPGDTSHNIEVEGEALTALAIPAVSLSTSTCATTGTVVVEINMAAMPDDIVGGQFFLNYNTSKLTFSAAEPGDAPFEQEIFELVNTGAGTIAYAVGVDEGVSGTSVPTTMARLTFTAADSCTQSTLVTWDRTHAPPSRLTNAAGDEYLPTLQDLNDVTIDSTPPAITCPLDYTGPADAPGCSASVTVGTATAVDTCDSTPVVTGARSDSLALTDPYPAGVTTITWTATDACNNSDSCMQTITIDPVNEMVLTVDLGGSIDAGPFTRCITFDFWDCPAAAPSETVSMTLTFEDGEYTGTVDVPCGTYTCMTARDKLHTLRRTVDPLGTSGTQYVASFTGGDALVGGNLNDDEWIDILDFGIFIGQYTAPASGADTTCATVGPHADIDGDGVVFTSDYTFISTNFLQTHEANCCPPPLPMFGWQRPTPQSFSGPITRVSVQELRRRGLYDLIAGDLNHDGWLDVHDMEAFAGGSRP